MCTEENNISSITNCSDEYFYDESLKNAANRLKLHKDYELFNKRIAELKTELGVLPCTDKDFIVENYINFIGYAGCFRMLQAINDKFFKEIKIIKDKCSAKNLNELQYKLLVHLILYEDMGFDNLEIENLSHLSYLPAVEKEKMINNLTDKIERFIHDFNKDIELSGLITEAKKNLGIKICKCPRDVVDIYNEYNNYFEKHEEFLYSEDKFIIGIWSVLDEFIIFDTSNYLDYITVYNHIVFNGDPEDEYFKNTIHVRKEDTLTDINNKAKDEKAKQKVDFVGESKKKKIRSSNYYMYEYIYYLKSKAKKLVQEELAKSNRKRQSPENKFRVYEIMLAEFEKSDYVHALDPYINAINRGYGAKKQSEWDKITKKLYIENIKLFFEDTCIREYEKYCKIQNVKIGRGVLARFI